MRKESHEEDIARKVLQRRHTLLEINQVSNLCEREERDAEWQNDVGPVLRRASRVTGKIENPNEVFEVSQCPKVQKNPNP